MFLRTLLFTAFVGLFHIGGSIVCTIGGEACADNSPKKIVFRALDASKSFLDGVYEIAPMLFEDREHAGSAVESIVEMNIFYKSMKQKKIEWKALTWDNVKAIEFYLEGLRSKSAESKLSGALEWFERALELDPLLTEARCQKAMYYLISTSEWDKAKEELDLAYKNDPDNYEVLRSLAFFHLLKHEWDPAYGYLKKASEKYEKLFPKKKDQKDPRLFYYWGMFYDPYWFRGSRGDKGEPELSKARVHYIYSLQTQHYFLPSANEIIRSYLIELEESKNQNTTIESGESMSNFQKALIIFQPYIDWHLKDVRLLGTYAHSNSYLSTKALDEKTKKNRCSNACGYVKRIGDILEEVEINPPDEQRVHEDIRYSKETCGC